MSVLSDNDLALVIRNKSIVTPFYNNVIKQEVKNAAIGMENVISYGCSSYGYDIRCSNEFKIFTNVNTSIIDPKHFTENNFVDVVDDNYIIIPPNSFALTISVEYFNIPRDVIGICFGKSTYARCGIICNVTPLEPEWEGHLTIELSNTTPLPAKIYANEGIAQIVFIKGNSVCTTSYKDRAGKYQSQVGITLPKCWGWYERREDIR